jgi:hypothetical protein
MHNDDERDYAEERANLADMRREQEGETAFEALAGRLASTLRTQALAEHDDLLASIDRLRDEVNLRQAPNVHRYALLARKQHTARLAIEVAAGIDAFVGYDLRAGTQHVADAYVVTHAGSNLDDALRHAVAQVILVVERFLAEEEQRETDAREQADRDETEAYLRRVTR